MIKEMTFLHEEATCATFRVNDEPLAKISRHCYTRHLARYINHATLPSHAQTHNILLPYSSPTTLYYLHSPLQINFAMSAKDLQQFFSHLIVLEMNSETLAAVIRAEVGK